MTDNAGPLPVHSQIAAEIVRRAIAPGRDPRMPLPTESEIQSDYGVSRGTARQALTELREAGVIVTTSAQDCILARPEPVSDEAN
ncbi:GntR family transcriptional regulator [Virgisporangium aurantiacum]|uniref:GntR family transcriptional regulator n=1 Tax=Virgisporangium aurantiacum TaxID=175570 RepID=UPI0019512F3A